MEKDNRRATLQGSSEYFLSTLNLQDMVPGPEATHIVVAGLCAGIDTEGAIASASSDCGGPLILMMMGVTAVRFPQIKH